MQKKRLLPLTAIVVAILLATTGMSVITARFLDNGSTTAPTATEAAQINSTSAVSAKPPVVLAALPAVESTATPVPVTEPTVTPVQATEPAPTTVPVVTPTPVPDVQLISLEDTTKIALAQVAGDAVILKSKLDRDDNTFEYEFKVTVGGFTYEIEINAVTGAVIGLDKEDGSDCQKPDNQRFGSQRAIDQRSAQAAENIPYANSQGYQKSTSCR